MEPKKNYVLDGQTPGEPAYPGGDPIADEAKKREMLLRNAESGPLGNSGVLWGYDGGTGPRSQEAYNDELQRQEAVRAARGGLPDK